MNDDKPIIVAFDFSPCSVSALRAGVRIVAWTRAPLAVLHVVTPTPPVLPSAIPGMIDPLSAPVPMGDDLVAQARRRWDASRKDVPGADTARFEIALGNPRDVILDTVRREQPVMLIVGAHSSSDAYRSIGTTAAACAQWAATRVLVVRARHQGPFRSIVACVDFSETSSAALEQAITVALEEEASLHVLHVYSDPWHGLGPPDEIRRHMPDFADRYRDSVREHLRQFCAPLAHDLNALKAEFHAVEAANHAEGIVGFITRQGCDMVALGTRGKFNLRDYFWGSTAERVVRAAHCSVLAVKPRGFAQREEYQPLADTAAAMAAG